MSNNKNSVEVKDVLTRDDVDKVSEEFITNLQNQSQHHQTMSVKAQGALEVVPQMVEALLKLLNDGEESKKK